jgi:hypothetical protein
VNLLIIPVNLFVNLTNLANLANPIKLFVDLFNLVELRLTKIGKQV